MTIAVSTGTGKYPIKPAAKSKTATIVTAAVIETACVFPPNCSFIEVLEILPFTGQLPVSAETIFPAAQAKISLLSSIL